MSALELALFLLAAVGLNVAAAVAAYRRDAVTGDGAVAGALLGAVIFAAGGVFGWVTLMLFFAGSTVASRVGATRKRSLGKIHEKGDRRDAVQVAANGGVAAVALVLHRLTGDAVFAAAAVGAFAAANADTWASELGVLSNAQPRLVFSRRRVEPGTSGAVSTAGTVAGVAGALLVAGWYALSVALTAANPAPAWSGGPLATARAPAMLLVAVIAGFTGTSVDSILGATVQARYRDPSGRSTERRRGDHGANELVRGLRWVTNDVVNAVSVLVAAVAAGVGAGLLGGAG